MGSRAGRGQPENVQGFDHLISDVTSGRTMSMGAALVSFPSDSPWEASGSLLSGALAPVPGARSWLEGLDM